MVKHYVFVRETAVSGCGIDLDSVHHLSQARSLLDELPSGDVIILPSDKANGMYKQLNRGNSGYKKVIVRGDL